MAAQGLTVLYIGHCAWGGRSHTEEDERSNRKAVCHAEPIGAGLLAVYIGGSSGRCGAGLYTWRGVGYGGTLL